MAAPARFPLAVTLPAEVLERRVVPRFGFPFRLLLVLGLLPLLLAASALAAYRQQQSERIYSGVRVFGLDLSRMTRDEAADALRRHIVELGRRRFDLRFDDEAIGVSLATLGFTVDGNDVPGLVGRAWAVGRDDDLRYWLQDQLALFRHGYDVAATGQFDRERAAAVLGRIAPDVERVTLNADISVHRAGDRFEIHTSPAQTGRRLNAAATLDRLQEAMVGAVPDHVDLVLDEAPPSITDADVAPAHAAIELLLGSSVEFRDGQRVWRLEPAAAFDMLEVNGLKQAQPPVTVTLNETKLAQFVERTARAADDPAVNPYFAIEGGEVVVKPGRDGRLADAAKTLELTRERIFQPGPRVVEIVFTEDKPWLYPQDLESARLLANAVLDLPITIETPVQPGIPEKKWTLGRAELLQMLVLPNTRNVSRDFGTLAPAQRPTFEVVLDSGRVANFVGREIAPWVSEDPIDAALELRTTRVEVPNPDYTAAKASIDPGLLPTLVETRQRVELRNARDGRGPDFDGTFAQVQAMFRRGTALLAAPATPAANVAPAPPRPAPAPGATPAPQPTRTPLPVVTPVALTGEQVAELAQERRVTVRLAPRRPRVVDLDLAPAQEQANALIGEPVSLYWQTASWTVSRDELASYLRYQVGRDGKLSAYLSRDGLIAKATQIAREAERGPLAPRSSLGEVLPLDVPNTAAVIWQRASAPRTERAAEIVWTEEDPATVAPEAQLPGQP